MTAGVEILRECIRIRFIIQYFWKDSLFKKYYSLMEIDVPNSETSFVSITLRIELIPKDLARSTHGICENAVQSLLIRGSRHLRRRKLFIGLNWNTKILDFFYPKSEPVCNVGTGTSPKLKIRKISNLVGEKDFVFRKKNFPKLCGIDRSPQELAIAPSLASHFSFLASGEVGKVGQLSRISLISETRYWF